MEERIICSAIWFDDSNNHVHQPINIKSGFVICGMRHHNCFTTLSVLSDYDFKKVTEFKKGMINHEVQGFITTKNRFVDREEAAIIAFNSGQISVQIEKLFSEDLY
jgi:hypothetical protein